MTREDIEKCFPYHAAGAAMEYYEQEHSQSSRVESDDVVNAFEAGADWAQEFMIERACDWLRNNIDFYVETNYDEDFRVDIEQLLKDIRKAMVE